MGSNTQGSYRTLPAESAGIDLGSALSIIFTDKEWKLVVGHSKGDQVWKFPCGKIEQRDCPLPKQELVSDRMFVSAAAKRCALRELEAEVGFTERYLLFFHQLNYVRSWKVKDGVTHAQKELQQFHFIGIMPEGIALPEEVLEREEMDVRAYWDIGEVLKRSMQQRYSRDKFNPFHALALVEALLFLRKTIGNDPMFQPFFDTIRALEKDNLHIDTLGYELEDQIKTKRI